MNNLFKPKSIDYYKSLTNGGEYKVNLTQEEACVILKTYDYGADVLSDSDKQFFNSVIAKLKDQIWP